MGRVVKNARVNTQRYQVYVPRVEHQEGDEEAVYAPQHATEPELMELPSPQSPPIDVDASTRKIACGDPHSMDQCLDVIGLEFSSQQHVVRLSAVFLIT